MKPSPLNLMLQIFIKLDENIFSFFRTLNNLKAEIWWMSLLCLYEFLYFLSTYGINWKVVILFLLALYGLLVMFQRIHLWVFNDENDFIKNFPCKKNTTVLTPFLTTVLIIQHISCILLTKVVVHHYFLHDISKFN